jgi:hypothetical protein
MLSSGWTAGTSVRFCTNRAMTPMSCLAIAILKHAARSRAASLCRLIGRHHLSQASVSRELREALEKALCANDRLTEELADQIKNMELVPVHGSFHGNRGRVVNKIEDRLFR